MNEEMKKTIKIPWKVYMKAAYEDIKRMYPSIKEDAKFMRTTSYESDSEVYDIPVYVEFEIE